MIPGSISHDFGSIGFRFHMDLAVFGSQTCCLACLVASLWCPRGPWGDPGTLGSTRKDMQVQALIFVDCWLI